MFETIAWRDGEGLALLDQRLLPEREETMLCRDLLQVADAIKQMVVRGAPAIGVTAAYGLAVAAINSRAKTAADLLAVRTDEARRYFGRVVEEFPESEYAKKARSRAGVKDGEKPAAAAAAVDSKPESQ